jgi:hypothetical protein
VLDQDGYNAAHRYIDNIDSIVVELQNRAETM